MINEWKGSPLTEAIDSQVLGMPDRPDLVLAVFKLYQSPETLDFRSMETYKANFLRDVPLTYFNQRVLVKLYGFESADTSAFMGAIAALAEAKIDEGAIYVAGVPKLHIVKINT